MKKHKTNIYPLHELQRQGLKAYFNALAANLQWQAAMLNMGVGFGFVPPHPYTEKMKKLLDASLEISELLSKDYTKPSFSQPTETILNKDFGDLLNFKRDIQRNDPKVLIVAPMSGHHATLLRDTVAQLLPHHDVYIIDWKDARTVPLSKGDFGFDDYVAYVQDFIKAVGPETHVMAFSQSTVPTLAAVSLMAAEGSACQPLSMVLMGGPIDTRAAETAIIRLAQGKSIDWFTDNMIAEVPEKYEGGGRLVYPGFLQLFSFMAMNPQQHQQSFLDLYKYLAEVNDAEAAKIKSFYNEYLAVCDLPAKFYLETVEKVFLDQQLAKGTMIYQGQKVNPALIAKTALMTVEGGKDDIVAPGQTIAAHGLCSGLQDSQRFHYLQKDAGHYSMFSGPLWQEDICPQVVQFIRRIAASRGLKHTPPAPAQKRSAP